MGVYAEILKRREEEKQKASPYAAMFVRRQQEDHSKMVLDLGGVAIPGTHAQSTSPFATGPSTVDMAKDIPQAAARTVGTVGISAGNTAFKTVGKEAPFQDEIDTTGSPITRAIFW